MPPFLSCLTLFELCADHRKLMAPSRDHNAIGEAWAAEVAAIEAQTGRKVLLIKTLFQGNDDDEDDDDEVSVTVLSIRIPSLPRSRYTCCSV